MLMQSFRVDPSSNFLLPESIVCIKRAIRVYPSAVHTSRGLASHLRDKAVVHLALKGVILALLYFSNHMDDHLDSSWAIIQEGMSIKLNL